jgi:hypothetical protein
MTEFHMQEPRKHIAIPYHQLHNPFSPASNECFTCRATSIPFPTNPSPLKMLMKRGIGRESNRAAFARQVKDLRKNAGGNSEPHPFSPSCVCLEKAKNIRLRLGNSSERTEDNAGFAGEKTSNGTWFMTEAGSFKFAQAGKNLFP